MGQPGELSELETVFEWMLLTPVDTRHHSNVTLLFFFIYKTYNATIKQFWKHEEVPSVHCLSPEEDVA